MKIYYLVFVFFTLLCFVIIGKCDVIKSWEFGNNEQVLVNKEGKIGWMVKETDVPLNVSDCCNVSYVKVTVKNYLSTPSVTYDGSRKVVSIKYRPLDISASKYTVLARGYARPGCIPDLPPLRANRNLNPNPAP